MKDGEYDCSCKITKRRDDITLRCNCEIEESLGFGSTRKGKKIFFAGYDVDYLRELFNSIIKQTDSKLIVEFTDEPGYTPWKRSFIVHVPHDLEDAYSRAIQYFQGERPDVVEQTKTQSVLKSGGYAAGYEDDD
jgi:hypothetical protein